MSISEHGPASSPNLDRSGGSDRERSNLILIAEDSRTQAVLLEHTLSKNGYQVIAARNGRDAFDLAVRHAPSLIISDIVMPVMDGFELCRAIKSGRATKDICVILLTALSDPEDIIHALESNADCFITKPYQEEYLLAQVERMMQQNAESSQAEDGGQEIDLRFAGRIHKITTRRQQILNLLLSTFESAMQKNVELLQAQSALQMFNAELELRVRQRTEALTAEIVERQRIEVEKTSLAASLELILKSTAEGVWGIDCEGNISFANDATVRILGYPREELIGKSAYDLIAGSRGQAESSAGAENPVRLCLKSGRPQAVDREAFINRDGIEVPVDYAANPMIENGRVKGVVVTFNDISVRLRHEEMLERRMRRLEALRTIDLAILQRESLDGVLAIVSDLACRELNMDAAAILMLDADKKILKFGHGSGFRGPHPDLSVPVTEGIAGVSFGECKNLFYPDVPQHLSTLCRAELLDRERFASYFALPLIVSNEPVGVIELFSRTRFEPDDEWTHFAETLAGQMAIALDQSALFESLKQSNVELREAYEMTLDGWSRALDLRDRETEGHTQRVTHLTVALARTMGISEEEIVYVRRGALLHDIGKMGIPDSILLKPGKLTEEEWKIMKNHPVYAYELLHPIPYLQTSLDIPYCHHEKWDGTGYPRGLSGEEIPLCARIFAVVDIWDALRSDRPYRPAWPAEKALEHIRSLAGTHLEPSVVEAFLNMKGISDAADEALLRQKA